MPVVTASPMAGKVYLAASSGKAFWCAGVKPRPP